MNNSRLPIIRAVAKRLLPAVWISVISFQSVAVADSSYGPIRAGETLSSIVNENYVVSPFPDQAIMREIFRVNPNAFIYNNMGLLKQGVTLTLPSDETIAQSLSVSLSAQPSRARVQSTPVLPNRQEIQALEEKLATVRGERDRANEKLRKLESETVDLTARVADLESSNIKLNEEIKASDNALKLARAELAKAQSSAEAQSQVQGAEGVDSVEQAAQLAQRDQRIKALEVSITELQGTQSKALLDLQASLDAKVGEQKALEDRVKVLTKSTEEYETQLAKLKKKNESLVVELAESRTVYDQLRASRSASTSDITTDESSGGIESVQGNNGSGSDAASNAGDTSVDQAFDISKLNTQNISSQLEKSMTFPVWGVLLGMFALGLTTLMMLVFKRRSKQVAVDPMVTFQEPIAETISDDIVFRSADPERIEPDIETLRVPPRRDPSRVAILDPTMNDQAHAANDLSEVAVSGRSEVSDEASYEAELKLAMAEAYGELGDIQAANELLAEVQMEGSQQQSASAQIMLNRLAG